jgi:hypothetical protein
MESPKNDKSFCLQDYLPKNLINDMSLMDDDVYIDESFLKIHTKPFIQCPNVASRFQQQLLTPFFQNMPYCFNVGQYNGIFNFTFRGSS